ncbi:hypothetical protein PUW24_19875 [Paenibacillus urinalis]|uniref:Small peptidoglycan-associated lipoprotein n=1 Tax=Paenibacillus urinalis TaxID=521520 RepID=A0AAX3N5G1_9BACL|nr:hypothetical protein [Paenibacillus urinalis]WDH84950.1 hypothetical protein PUW23_12355 [Paenibacillus urinalis]WDH96412.1 hypothetical protein PUW24_19875 [Paenibacillus urinalis]WDI04634.1 hypothetical protein PUW25_12035 [Paenibacillus urinalis]
MTKFKLLVVFLFLYAADCSGSSKEAELSYFLSDTEGMYKIHLFRDSSRELDNELLEYMNSSEDLLEVIQGVQLYDINTEDNLIRAERVDVEEIPTMLITDDKEIVLRTKSIQELKNYFEDLIN